MARIFISHSSRDDEAAAWMKAWLASQGFETTFLDFDKTTGIPPGADWEKTLYREVELSQAVIIIQTPSWLASKWCFAEFTQARALGKAIFLVIETPTGDAQISADIQTLNLLSDREGGLERLSRELVRIALDAQGGFKWDARRPPFPGLLAFQEEDAAIYFGRDDDIRRLIERLEARRAQGGNKLVVLLGSSGSGKSSLLRAGVIPRLKRAGRNWIVTPPMRPRLHPVDALALALAAASGPGAEWRNLKDSLLGPDPERALEDLANDLRVKAGAGEAQILIPIDQGEEVFGVADSDEAKRFLEILSEALSENLPFMAVMAIRSDFLGQLQSAAALTARFEEFSLGPMPLARIPQIIQGPAKVAGVNVEETFVQQAARDAATEDALPLLAFALRELWDRSSDKVLSLNGYKALGDENAGITPLENAVREAADAVLAEAKPADDELAALREAFVPPMVRVNDQGEYVRRPARLDELPAKAQPLLERLAKARLLIVRQDGDARIIEVAHEALLRKWPLLRSWLDAARVFLIGKQQLEQDLRDWDGAAENDKAGALLTGLKLNRARGWLVEHPTQLTTRERGFIQASIQRVEAEERRKARQRRIVTRASIAAAVVLACFAVVAGWEWREADEQRNRAEAQKLAAQGNAAFAENSRYVDTSALLAVESTKLQPLLESDALLRATLTLLPRQVARVNHDGPVRAYHFSSDSRYVATASDDKNARIFEAATGREIARLLHEDAVSSVQFSPDGRHLATASDDKSVRIFEVITGKETRLDLQDWVLSVQFSPDGRYVASRSVDKTARIFAATGQEIARVAHEGAVFSVQFSPDGRYVATASDDKSARILEVATGKELTRLLHEGAVSSVQFSPDGRHLATASDDKSARILEVATGKELTRLLHEGAVFSVQFSPDGRYVATASDDKSARIFEAVLGKEIARLNHESRILDVQFSPDGRYLATASDDNNARIFETATGKEITRLPHEGAVSSVQFSPDSQFVATGSVDNSARIFEAMTGKKIAHVNHEDVVWSVRFSADGRFVASSSYDKSVRVFEATMGKGVARLKHEGIILCVRFSPDGRYVAIGSFDWSARVFEADTGREVARLNHQGVVSSIEFSKDGQYVASGGADNSALIFEAASGKEIARLDHGGWVQSAKFSPDGRYVATASGDNSARIFAVAAGKEIARLPHGGAVSSVQFSPDGRYLATASDDTSARIFEAATGKEISRLPHTGAVSSVQFSPDSRYVATGSADNSARIFAMATGKEVARLPHEGAVSSVQFSADGRYLATASDDTSARIFEAATGKEITRLNHESRIFDVQFSADGRYIATGGEDGRTRVFEAATGKEIARLPHEGIVFRVQFRPGERSLRSLVSTPGHLGIYSDLLVPEDLIVETCRRLTRNLTTKEWKTYFPDAPYHKTCPEIP
jgi:WD40 repeat protein